MKILKTTQSLQETLGSIQGLVGFVPTMGALHQGHLSLIQKSLEENPVLVVSIFVNPTQFDNPVDLEKYPRSLANDLSLIKQIAPDALVFTPSVSEIYGNTVDAKEYAFEGLDRVMEGASRKGHFQGVATVVEQLLNLVKPDSAYFGEKDFQQLQIIKKMVAQRKYTTTIVGCPIKREPDGLAMSSRNQRLSSEQRLQAPLLFQALQEAKSLFQSQNAAAAHRHVEALFAAQSQLNLDYFSICSEENLMENQLDKPEKVRGFIAAQLGEIRLIDNLKF